MFGAVHPNMRFRHPLSQPFARRRRALDAHASAALTGDTHAIHQARVASRRLREVLPLVGRVLDDDEVGALQRRMRRVTRLLGPVREADVTLGLAIEHREAQPAEAPALALVELRLSHERDARFGKVTRDLHADKMAKWLERAAHVEQALAEAADGRPWRKELAVRLRARAAQLLGAVEEAGLLFVSDRLHEVRITVKRLRYVLELAGELRQARLRASVTALRGVQDILGHLHDLDVLVGRVQAVAAEKDTTKLKRQALEALTLRLDSERRAAHAEYLSHRLQLAQLADMVMDEVAPRVEHAPLKSSAPARRKTAAKQASQKTVRKKVRKAAVKKTAVKTVRKAAAPKAVSKTTREAPRKTAGTTAARAAGAAKAVAPSKTAVKKTAAVKRTAVKQTAAKKAAATRRVRAAAGSAASSASAAPPTPPPAASSAPRSARRRPS